MGSIIGLSTTAIRDLYTNVSTAFDAAFNEASAGLIYPIISTVVNSTNATMHYDFFQLMSTVSEFKDMRKHTRIQGDDYSITDKEWELTIDITRKEIDDDSTGLVMPKIQQAAVTAAIAKDRRLALAFDHAIAGTATTFGNGFDGTTLVADSHTWSSGYTTAQDNKRTGILDGTYGSSNIKGAWNSLSGFKHPTGDVIGTQATHLIVGNTSVFDAKTILNSQFNLIGVGGSGGTVTVYERGQSNPLYQTGLTLVHFPYVSAAYWMLADCSRAIRPFIFQLRKDVEFTSKLDGDTEFETNVRSYGTYARYEVGYGPWFLCVGSTGAASSTA